MADTAVRTDKPYKLWIGGDAVEGSNGTYEVVNPATEEVVGLAPEASAADAEAAAAAAAAAFPAWSQTTPQQRSELLARAADLLEKEAPALVPLAQAETGGVNMMAFGNVYGSLVRLRRYVRGALEPREQMMVPVPNMGGPGPAAPGLLNAMGVRQPVGVVACITSYNVPMTNVMGKLAPALAMGNTVVIKPAPQDPLEIIRLTEIFHEAGFPPGVVNLVVGSKPESSSALVASKHVDMVSFTGSTTIGLMINEVCARDMKRVLFELGGKGACVVFDTADLDAAAGGIASTWTFHAGQICTAPTRVVAHRSIYDQLMEKLTAIAKPLKVGDPTQQDTIVGPVVSGVQRGRVETLIKAGTDEGGTILTGGGRPSHLERGYFIEPTLVAGVNNDMKIAREEIFGPVVVAIPFDTEEEGIAIANDSDYGLYDYVYSGDTVQGMRVAQQLRCGNVGINTVNRNPETPFGGFKKSGLGRDGGSFAMHAYTEWQSLVWPG
jgi:acyl-CoA reductase-like NAD-dependent aldehyde dehydrogenase